MVPNNSKEPPVLFCIDVRFIETIFFIDFTSLKSDINEFIPATTVYPWNS